MYMVSDVEISKKPVSMMWLFLVSGLAMLIGLISIATLEAALVLYDQSIVMGRYDGVGYAIISMSGVVVSAYALMLGWMKVKKNESGAALKIILWAPVFWLGIFGAATAVMYSILGK
jgi:hypothetical protein